MKHNHSLAIYLLLLAEGAGAFTSRPLLSSSSSTVADKTSFVAKPFYSSTELQSEASPSAEDEEEDNADQIVVEAVGDALSEISTEDAPEEFEKERFTVFLGNLPFELSKDEISDMGAKYGEVLAISVPTSRETGLPRGFAFLDFKTQEEADHAISNLNELSLNGRNIRASISDPNQKKEKKQKRVPDEDVAKIYVGNLPFDTSKEDLLEFYKGFVEATEAYIPINADTGTGRGFGFVTVKKDDLQSAIDQTNGLEYNGRPLVVNKPLPPGERKERRPARRERGTKLYVGNLAFDTDVEILTEVFGEFGEVLDAYMPEDPVRGGSRGFGFVTMARDNALEAVNELDGCELDGRFIRVNEAMPKGRRQPMDGDDDEDESF